MAPAAVLSPVEEGRARTPRAAGGGSVWRGEGGSADSSGARGGEGNGGEGGEGGESASDSGCDTDESEDTHQVVSVAHGPYASSTHPMRTPYAYESEDTS